MTRELLESLVRIKNLNEFAAFRKYLEEEKAYDMAIMAGTNDDRVMHLAQGAYRRITMLIEAIEAAPKLLEKDRR